MTAVENGIVLDSYTSPSESDSETHLARSGRTETPASMAVVAVVPKALDKLLGADSWAAPVSVTFAYEGHEITATADEVTAARPSPDAGHDARGGESASV